MEQFFNKKYKLTTSDNFEEFLKLIDVSFFQRKIVLAVSPILVLTHNDDGSYTITYTVPFRTTTTNFRLGEEFEDERPDGVKIKSVITLEGNTFIERTTAPNGKQYTTIREFTPDKVIVTCTIDGWDGSSVRTYDPIE